MPKDLSSFHFFFLNKNTILNLSAFIKKIRKSDSATGVILIIDKNSFEIWKMSFLAKAVPGLIEKGLKVGIWGLPQCVINTIFNKDDYFQLYSRHLDLVAIDHLSEKHYKLNYNSAQISACRACSLRATCSGLGNLWQNLAPLNLETVQKEFLKESSYKKTAFSSAKLRKKQAAILDYCRKNQLPRNTRRSFFYATVALKTAAFDYGERLIYSCKYLDSKELEAEENFLASISANQSFVKYIFKNFSQKYYWYIFSIALDRNQAVRESYYIYFKDTEKSHKVKFLESEINLKTVMDYDVLGNVYGIGYDFLAGNFQGVKLYTRIKDKKGFPDFLEKICNFTFPAEILEISTFILFEKRFAENGELLTYKVELTTCHLEKMTALFVKYYNLKFNLAHVNCLSVICAFDLSLTGSLNKITVYYK
jgi:hypothetical protein